MARYSSEILLREYGSKNQRFMITESPFSQYVFLKLNFRIVKTKKMHITSQSTIKDVKEEFSQMFPYLKIEFFRKGYRAKQANQKDYIIPGNIIIGSIYNHRGERYLDIKSSMTVRELEIECEKLFGICIQVYRRSGNLWLETSMTENWTIGQQNKNGSEISSSF
jgi:hypothetical protein